MTDPGGDDTASGRDIDRLEIELRVTGDDLDPERITRMLGASRRTTCRYARSASIVTQALAGRST